MCDSMYYIWTEEGSKHRRAAVEEGGEVHSPGQGTLESGRLILRTEGWSVHHCATGLRLLAIDWTSLSAADLEREFREAIVELGGYELGHLVTGFWREQGYARPVPDFPPPIRTCGKQFQVDLQAALL